MTEHNQGAPDYTHAPEEADAIGALVAFPTCRAEVMGLLVPEAFEDPRHRIIFRAVQEAGDAGDAVEIKSALLRRGELNAAGGDAYIAFLVASAYSAHRAVAYATAVRAAHQRRQLAQLGAELTTRAVSEPGDVSAITEQLGGKLLQVTDHGSKHDVTAVADLLAGVLKQIEREQNAPGGITGVDTGFPTLNRLTGGWQNGNLNVVGARPSVGKTTLALTVALHAAKLGKVVYFVSAEMSAGELVRNMLCAEGGLRSSLIRTGGMTKAHWSKLDDAATALWERKIYIDDSSGPSPQLIRRRATRLALKHGRLDIVIVDYLQLVHSARGDNREQQVASITRDLKTVARELDCPVIALAQLNRALDSRKDKRPQLSDLRESGAIEQDGDVIVLLHDPSAAAGLEPKSTKDIEAIVAKNRNGARGTVRLVMTPAEFRFAEGTVGGDS